MENLLLLETAAQRSLALNTIISLIAIGCALSELCGSLNKQPAKRGRKRRRQKQSFPVATLVTLVCLAAGALYLFVYGSDRVRDFRLDRTEAITVSAQGTAVSAGRVRTGKHRYQYRLELDCGGETLTLHIHKSLMDAYALEPGAVYDVTYYPRTKTLCKAEKAE